MRSITPLVKNPLKEQDREVTFLQHHRHDCLLKWLYFYFQLA